MRQPTSGFRILSLYVWAVLLTITTTVLGAAPLRVLRARLGSTSYWLITVGLMMLLWGISFPWAAGALAIVAIVVGTYAEFEDRGLSVGQASALSVISTVLSVAAVFYFWAISMGKAWRSGVLAAFEKLISDAQNLGLPISDVLTAEGIALQTPSLVFAIVCLALFLALMLERTFSRYLGIPMRRREKLSHFRVPEVLIWPTIFALLGAFGKFDLRWLEVLSMNVLNICAMLYFFQGLAVLSRYFEVFRVGVAWRIIWVLLLAVQLPLVLGIIGVADYWMDFRKFFHKKASELQKKRVEE